MASKYPSVTAQAKAPTSFVPPKPGTKVPVNFPKGKELPKPSNDNIPGGGGPKLPIGKLPNRLRLGGVGDIASSLAVLFNIKKAIEEITFEPSNVILLPSGAVNSRYWTYTCLCAGQCPGGRPSLDNGISTACNTSYSDWVRPAPAPTTVTVTPVRDYKLVGLQPTSKPLWRHVGRWNRVAGAPTPTPMYEVTAFAPQPLPLEVPLVYPIAPPATRVRVLPPFPGDEPTEPKPETKPEAEPKPLPLPKFPFPIITVPNNPLPVPIVVPGNTIELQPGPTPGKSPPTSGAIKQLIHVRQNGKYHRNKPPKAPATSAGGKGMKPIERKAKMRAAMTIAWAGVNTATEVMDFVVAMHKSIPKESGKRLPAKASKAQVVKYMMSTPDAWRAIDLAEGIENYINMQFSDMVAALGSDSIKNLSQQMDIVTGLDSAINLRHSGKDDYKGEGDLKVHNVGKDIPTLDIDRQNGVISVITPFGVVAVPASAIKKGS